MKKIILGLITVFSLASCTDKNLDDYRRDTVLRELAKIQSISGEYRGEMISSFDGSEMGYVTLKIEPDTVIRDSSDGLKKEPRAVFRGKLSHHGSTRAELFFDQGYYNDIDGTIVVTIAFPDGKMLKIFGGIYNGILQATIDPYGFPGYGAKFVLTKNIPLKSDQIKPRESKVQIRSYRGDLKGRDGELTPITMSIHFPKLSPELAFYNLFLPARDVRVALDIGNAQLVDKGFLDNRAGTLSATFVTTAGGDRFENEMQCNQLPDDAWDCMLANNARGRWQQGVLTRVP